MAILQNIRNRAGILIAAIIGFALLAFVLGPVLKSGSSIFTKPQFEIAKIVGKSISIQTYQQKVEKLMEIYRLNSGQSSIDEATAENIREQTWQELIREYVLKDEYEELGVAVCSDELFDMVQGQNPHPIIREMFTNNETGILDKANLIQFLKSMDQDATGAQKTIWLYLENQIITDRTFNKYYNLIKKGLYVTSLQAKSKFYETNKKVDFNYIIQRFNSIPDSNIIITDSDIMKYYKKHQKDFEQTASRDIEYIPFEILPTSEDNKAAEEWIYNIKEEFENTGEVKQFVNLNADTPYDETNYKYGELPELINDFIFSAQIGDIYGPYFENEAYKIAKLSEINYLPDSVKARHIFIQPYQTMDKNQAKEKADSLKNLIENGADFAALALLHSADGSAQLGGDLGWFSEGTMVKPFNDTCFHGKKGDLTVVETQFGFHIIEILDKSKNVKKVQVAILDRKVEASSRTYQDIYTKASKFAGLNNTREKFENAVIEQGLTKRISNNILENDKRIVGLESPRELIRWVYNSEKNDVSPIFELGNRFVLALLTEVREKGIAPLDRVKVEIEVNVNKEKKAQQLIDKLKAEINEVQTLEELAQKLNTPVEEATDISFSSYSIPRAGVEPNVIATAANIKQGIISNPIKGANGVYVIFVNSVSELEETTFVAEKNKLMNNFQVRVNYEALEALKESANIQDNRAKFY